MNAPWAYVTFVVVGAVVGAYVVLRLVRRYGLDQPPGEDL